MLDDNDFPIESLFSSSWSSWDPNTNKVKGALGTYQQTFLSELQALAQKPTHRPRSTREWAHSVKHCCCDPVAPEIRKNYRDYKDFNMWIDLSYGLEFKNDLAIQTFSRDSQKNKDWWEP